MLTRIEPEHAVSETLGAELNFELYRTFVPYRIASVERHVPVEVTDRAEWRVRKAVRSELRKGGVQVRDLHDFGKLGTLI